MKLTDWIGLISFMGVASYSVAAGVKLYKNSRKPSARIAEDPVLRYSDFAESTAGVPICCQSIRLLAARGGTSIEYRFTNKEDTVRLVEVQVKFCPGCGRKL